MKTSTEDAVWIVRESADEAALAVREAADEAAWGVRAAAWTVEERVLWRASDATRAALRRALRVLEPLQRLVQTKLAWPLADRMADYGTGARTAVATTAVVAAAAAGIAGVQLADGEAAGGAPPVAPAIAAVAEVDATATLSGVAPDFEQSASGATTTVAAKAVPAEAASLPAPPAEPPAEVAWTFAQAFVRYEVGKVNEKTAATFSEVAAAPLAEALAEQPPRLPESAEVPEAQVLNVVLGEQKDDLMEASVSLTRLRAASEPRLTLRKTPEGWQVEGVRG